MLSNEEITALTHAGYSISKDKSRLQINIIKGYLQRSYWAENIPENVILRSIENSICFGLFYQHTQVGFARVISDKATFAYLADVFVLEEHRGKGLSKWLIQTIINQEEFKQLRRWMLATRDAHGLYKQFGFKALENSDKYLEIYQPAIYKNPTTS